MAGIVLVLALVVTGRTLSGSRLPSSAQPPGPTAAPAPYRVGERLACPLTHPVLAIAGGRSYRSATPPDRRGPPARWPATTRPPRRPPPATPRLPAGGSAEAGRGVPDPGGGPGASPVPAGRPGLGVVVPCPSLWPVPSPGLAPPAVCPRPACGGPGSGFLFEDSGFLVPWGHVGAYPEVGRRLVVAAARRPVAAITACPGERPLGRAPIRGAGGSCACCWSSPAT